MKDANNTTVRFYQLAPRKMEVVDGTATDITLGTSNELIQGAGKVIGNVQLIAASDDSPIAGLVGTNGNMLVVSNSTPASLVASNVKPVAPNVGGTSGTTTPEKCPLASENAPIQYIKSNADVPTLCSKGKQYTFGDSNSSVASACQQTPSRNADLFGAKNISACYCRSGSDGAKLNSLRVEWLCYVFYDL